MLDKPKESKVLPLPSIDVRLDDVRLDTIPIRRTDDNPSGKDTKTLALLDEMIGADPSTSDKPLSKEEIQKLLRDSVRKALSGYSKKETELDERLAEKLKETHKGTWDLLPKDVRDAILNLQKALIAGDLDALKTLAKDLKPEVAEKIAQLVEKNLRAEGAKVHIKSVDGQFLWYQDGAKNAVLVDKDGKAQVVAIEANEPDGPPNILEGKKPFKSVQTLAKEIAAAAAKNIASYKSSGEARPKGIQLDLPEELDQKEKLDEFLKYRKKYNLP